MNNDKVTDMDAAATIDAVAFIRIFHISRPYFRRMSVLDSRPYIFFRCYFHD